MVRLLFAALLSLLPLTAVGTESEKTLEKTAYSTDKSDLWWNPSESGWGMQLVQQNNFIFATLFIYGADGRPTWATAQLTAQNPFSFSGPLYLTTGPYFGAGSFNPAAVGVRQAGTMLFQSSNNCCGSVTYSIDGVVVTKAIQRQNLVRENYSGIFATTANLVATSCSNPLNNGSGTGAFAIGIAQGTSTARVVWVWPSESTCTMDGTYSQTGKFASISGSYTCSSGEVGTVDFWELTNRIGMISGRISASNNLGCTITGRFSGLDPDRP